MTDFIEFLSGLDVGLLNFINQTGSNVVFDFIFPAITDLHKTFVFKYVFIPLLFFSWLKLYKHRGVFVFLFLLFSLGAGDFIGGKLKRFFIRPRPFEDIAEIIQRSPAGGFSFPSNHSINMICMAVFLSFFFPRHRWLLYSIAVLVLYSRVYNGVHYPSDALGGAIIGGLFGFIGAKACHLAISKFEKFKESKSNV